MHICKRIIGLACLNMLLMIMGLMLVLDETQVLAGQAGGAPAVRIPERFALYGRAAGLRFREPGKERTIGVGSLSILKDDVEDKEPVEIIWQFPSKIRLNFGNSSIFYDGTNGIQLTDPQKADAIQVLLEDSLEGFFSIVKENNTSRHLGSGYRLINSSPMDSCIDIIRVRYPDRFHNGKYLSKGFWFDCHTKLLGVVTYTDDSGIKVNVVLKDWRDIQGEKWPYLVERWENDKKTMALSLDAVTFAAAAEDGAFGGN